ncbi:unnamed protein product [Brassica rapa subsp. trilocularis]|uniref:(rape) hypothetical protein n=1 Tax=Brassica napus TaxID=3708 RepID=A0A816T775_BRANA|nr:unnamed protein product [Brassica napus]
MKVMNPKTNQLVNMITAHAGTIEKDMMQNCKCSNNSLYRYMCINRIIKDSKSSSLWARELLAVADSNQYVEKSKPVADPQVTGLIYMETRTKLINHRRITILF